MANTESELDKKKIKQTDKLIEAIIKLDKRMLVESKKSDKFSWKEALKGGLGGVKDKLQDKLSVKGVAGMLGVKDDSFLGTMLGARDESKKAEKEAKRATIKEGQHFAATYADAQIKAGKASPEDREKLIREGGKRFTQKTESEKILKELEAKEQKAQATGIAGAGLTEKDEKTRKEHQKQLDISLGKRRDMDPAASRKLAENVVDATGAADVAVADHIKKHGSVSDEKAAEIQTKVTDDVEEKILHLEEAQLEALQKLYKVTEEGVAEAKKKDEADIAAKERGQDASAEAELEKKGTVESKGASAATEPKAKGGIFNKVLDFFKNKFGKLGKSLTKVFGNFGKILGKVGKLFTSAFSAFKGILSKIPGLGKLLGGGAAAVGEGAAAAGGVAEAGAEGATVASKAGGLMGKAGGVLKKAGIVGAAVDVGMGVNDLLDGKEQKEMPTGWDAISPMKWGMYGGSKIREAGTNDKGDGWLDKATNFVGNAVTGRGLTSKDPATIAQEEYDKSHPKVEKPAEPKVAVATKELTKATEKAEDIKKDKETTPVVSAPTTIVNNNTNNSTTKNAPMSPPVRSLESSFERRLSATYA